MQRRIFESVAIEQEQRGQDQHITEQSQILEIQEAKRENEGHAIRVTVIQGGQSKNGYVYDEPALHEIARMIENAHAYADHSGEVSRSIRDMVGFYKDATFVPGQPPRVDATLHILSSADWLWTIIQESFEHQKPDLVGLSVDIFGAWKHDQASNSKAVTKVVQLNSCDVVTRPSAGGTFRRILHDHNGDTMLIKPGAKPTDPPTNQQPDDQGQQTPTTSQITEQQTSSQILEQRQLVEAQRVEVERMIQQNKLERAGLMLERRLQESILPQAVKAQIKERFTGRIFEESELDQDMTRALTMMAELTQSGLVRGNGFSKDAVISGQITESDKVAAAFEAMFGMEIDTAKLGNIKGFQSIREAYTRVTGDTSLQAGISGHSVLGNIRVAESAPIGRMQETDTTTATFTYLLGNAMNKRLLKDYQTWPAEWMNFCQIIPIKDFKQQSRIRMGDFASLSTVPEDGAYTAVSLQDSAATYAATKRGNLVQISRETIINDDLNAIRQIPTKLARAAAYTLAEFVYAFLSGNPTIYDGSALFTASTPHTNLGTTALSSASLQSGVTAMIKQTNLASKRIGIRPRWLIVPPDLQWVAAQITRSAGVPGSANNDINPMQGYVTPIVSPQLTDTNDWFLAASPMDIDTIEIGFVGGQVNPALFIQDMPLLGINFTQDVVSYKIRHEYGGAVVDFRGLYGANVS